MAKNAAVAFGQVLNWDILDYNQIPRPQDDEMIPKQLKFLHDTHNLHPYCYQCLKENTAAEDGPQHTDGTCAWKKGDFLCRCTGMPKNAQKTIPTKEWEQWSAEKQEHWLEHFDPVYAAYKYLNWLPRISNEGDFFGIKVPAGLAPQAIMLSCTSKRKVFRIGRRLGKTNVLAVMALVHVSHHSRATHTGREAAQEGMSGDVLIIAPSANQLANIFREVRKLLGQADDALKKSVVGNIKNPQEIEFANGSKILGRVAPASGSSGDNIRGEGASLVLFDEMDFGSIDVLDVIWPIVQESPEHGIVGSSTPRGIREGSKFFEFCNSPQFSEFNFPSQLNPKWTIDQEIDARTANSWQKYEREFLAQWGEQEGGVFPASFVEAILKDYKYGKQSHSDPDALPYRPVDLIYVMGIDWNHSTGNEIVVLAFDPKTENVFIVERATVEGESYRQKHAVAKIIELNREWQPKWIYADQGHGYGQIEDLHLHGDHCLARLGMLREHNKAIDYTTDQKYLEVDARLKRIVKPVEAWGTEEMHDTADHNRVTKVRTKIVFVQALLRRFENSTIFFPGDDIDLKNQLLGYIELKVSGTHGSIYGPLDKKRVGDHILDALFLANWAIAKEFKSLGQIGMHTFARYQEIFHQNEEWAQGSGLIGIGASLAQQSQPPAHLNRMQGFHTESSNSGPTVLSPDKSNQIYSNRGTANHNPLGTEKGTMPGRTINGPNQVDRSHRTSYNPTRRDKLPNRRLF